MKANETLNAARVRAGMTVSQLASRAGLPSSTISRYLAGTVEMSATRFLDLLRLAGVASVETGLLDDPRWAETVADVRKSLPRKGSMVPASLVLSLAAREYAKGQQ